MVVGAVVYICANEGPVVVVAEGVALCDVFVQISSLRLLELCGVLLAVLNISIQENVKCRNPRLAQDMVRTSADNDAVCLRQFKDNFPLNKVQISDHIRIAPDRIVEEHVQELVSGADFFTVVLNFRCFILAFCHGLLNEVLVVIRDSETVGKEFRDGCSVSRI